MTWSKLDDGFWSHPVIDQATLPAVGVYAKSLSYCGAHLTDGRITPDAARYMAKGKTALIRELVDLGLWQENGSGYVIPNFLEFNPSREQVEADRERISQVRREAGRRGGLATQQKRKQEGKQT